MWNCPSAGTAARTCRVVLTLAVVDPRLHVHGTEVLRIAGASTMPVITSDNTHTPSFTIGGMASDPVRQGARKS